MTPDDRLIARAREVRAALADLSAEDLSQVLVLARFVDVAEPSTSPTFLPVVRELRPARELYACRHPSTTISEARRRVTCTSCGAVVDPFSTLLALSRSPEALASVAAERARLAAEAERLRQDVERLKAAKRRASKP